MEFGGQDNKPSAKRGDFRSHTRSCAVPPDSATVPSICRVEQKTGKFCGTVTRCGPFFANVRDGLLRTTSEIWLAFKASENEGFFDKPASTTSKKLAQNHVQNQHNTTNRLARLLSCRAKSACNRPVLTPVFGVQNRSMSCSFVQWRVLCGFEAS
jgi:hypothetical protein